VLKILINVIKPFTGRRCWKVNNKAANGSRQSEVRHIAPKPVPAAAQSKAWVCGRSLAGLLGSNPAVGKDVFLL